MIEGTKLPRLCQRQTNKQNKILHKNHRFTK